MTDGVVQVGAGGGEVKGSEGVVDARADCCWAGLMYARSIASSTHWWICLRRQSYHCAAAANDFQNGSAIGSP